jgi:hypothetical protein
MSEINPTDEQIDELWDEIGEYFNLYNEVRNTVRAALNRWGSTAFQKPRLFVFTQKKKITDGRNFIVAIPEDKIEKIQTIHGSHNIYMIVNDIEVEGSFEDFIQEFGSPCNIKK